MIVWLSTSGWETGHSFTQLVGYDHVMTPQEFLDVLNESPLVSPKVVALGVAKFEQLRKSHGNSCFSLMWRSAASPGKQNL